MRLEVGGEVLQATFTKIPTHRKDNNKKYRIDSDQLIPTHTRNKDLHFDARNSFVGWTYLYCVHGALCDATESDRMVSVQRYI